MCFCVSEYPESVAWNILQSLNGFVGYNVFDGIAVFNVRKQDRYGPILDMSYKGQRSVQLDSKACDRRRKRDHVTIYGSIVIPALSIRCGSSVRMASDLVPYNGKEFLKIQI